MTTEEVTKQYKDVFDNPNGKKLLESLRDRLLMMLLQKNP